MAARSGMHNVINDLRLMTDAGTAEHSVDGVDYYTDDQLQRILDTYRADIYRELLTAQEDYAAGSAQYRQYYWSQPHVEQATSGTAAWYVTDGQGSVVGTANYAVDYDGHAISFTANTLGSARYLTYRSYDLNRAAATVWKEKAAHVADRFDVRTDNHDLKRSQLRKNYLDMAQSYLAKSRPYLVRLVREDLNT